jgi:L-gulonate 3-dehydrogenase
VVPATWTSQYTRDVAMSTLRAIGQSPVLLNKSIDGFLVNRLQYALLMEAFRLVQDGIASPQDVDAAVSQGLGLRWSFMGPFEV